MVEYANVEMIPVREIDFYDIKFPTSWLDDVTLKRYTAKSFEDDIRENGIKNPIVLQRLLNGRFKVLNGRHRFSVARKLGFTVVPCIVERW